MIYVYAITDRPDDPAPPVQGLEEASLRVVSYQDIGAVVSSLAASEAPPTEANVWKHEAVMEALMACGAVLPVRFGAVFADESAVRDVLAARYSGFVADLERVRGRVELGLRVLWDEDNGDSLSPSVTPSSRERRSPCADGRTYMLARLEEEREIRKRRRRAEVYAEEIHAPLAHLAAESAFQALVTPRLLLTAAYLVDRDLVTDFRNEVRALIAAHPALSFLCTGPWPPFSFVKGNQPDDGQASVRTG